MVFKIKSSNEVLIIWPCGKINLPTFSDGEIDFKKTKELFNDNGLIGKTTKP